MQVCLCMRVHSCPTCEHARPTCMHAYAHSEIYRPKGTEYSTGSSLNHADMSLISVHGWRVEGGG